MTLALCTNCGFLKVGAFCDCPECNSGPVDLSLAILLSDHHLLEQELNCLSKAASVIYQTEYDEEHRAYLFLYYIARKWPKILDINDLALPTEVHAFVEAAYRTNCEQLSGQQSPILQVSPITQAYWDQAVDARMQQEEDEWLRSVANVVLRGLGISKNIIDLAIRAGEGAVIQRWWHSIKSLLRSTDYQHLLATGRQYIGDAKAYTREVHSFARAIRNGWSKRTQQQGAYLRGTCMRLTELGELLTTLIEHKAGVAPLVGIDFKRTRQRFWQSYFTYVELVDVVLHPDKIGPS